MFSTTKLKIIALVFMLIDHIGEFIPNIPVYFRWIGRISAPLFLFCMVWGLHYTHNRKVYLMRMYIFGVLMAIMDVILNNIFLTPYTYVTNNIFVSLFLTGVICTISDIFKKDKKHGSMLLVSFILLQLVGTILCVAASKINIIGLYYTVGAICANLFFSEGSIVFPLLGLLLYSVKENPKKLAVVYTIACFLQFMSDYSTSKDLIMYLFLKHYQWMMIGALPFMYLYNNQKGKGLKYLFYAFYPTHIFILFWIGNAYFKHWFS